MGSHRVGPDWSDTAAAAENTIEEGGGGRSQKVSQAMGKFWFFVFFCFFSNDKGGQQRALSREWFSLIIFFFFWPCHATFRILVPWPGWNMCSMHWKQSPDHQTNREFSHLPFLKDHSECFVGNAFKLTRVKGRPMRRRFAVIQVREDGGLN